MAEPTYVASGTEFADTAQSISLTKPGSAAQNDLIIVRATHQSNGASITTPGTFTAISGTNDFATGDFRVTVCWRIVQTADTSWTWSTGPFNDWGLSWVLVRGVDTTTPINASGTDHIGNGTSVTPACTSSVNDTMLVVLAGADVGESRTWTVASGTKRVEATLGSDFLTHLIVTDSGGTAGSKSINCQQSGNNQQIDSTIIAVAPAASTAASSPPSRRLIRIPHLIGR